MKGIFSSISVAMLLITLFSLSSLVVYTQMRTKENFSHQLAADRVYNRFKDIENSLKEIFNKVSGINISVSANSITFEENLPVPIANYQNFSNDIQAFKQFAESANSLEIKVDTAKIMPKLPLTITPFNILYQHLNYGDKSYEIVPLYVENVTSYDVFIDVRSYGVTAAKWSSDCSKTKPCYGNLKFNITVLGKGGSWNDVQNLDPTKMSRLEMSLVAPGGLKGNILVFITNPAKFNVSSDITIFIKTRVDLQQTNEKIHVKYPPNIILVNNSVFESWKNDTVVIV